MRCITPPHSHGTVISSTMCLWRSGTVFPLASSSSATPPNTRIFLQVSQRHIGMALAQKRWREIDQSRAPSSYLPKRPSFMCFGDHEIFSAFARRFSFIFVTETNHDDVA